MSEASRSPDSSAPVIKSYGVAKQAMDFRHTRHVTKGMGQRGITDADIASVLDSPEWEVPVTRGRRFDGIVDGRRLCVVIDEHADPIRLVTVWWYEGDRE